MFTVEHHYDSTEVISIDDQDSYSDVEVLFCDEGVYITQNHLDMDMTDTILMSYQQFTDLITALDLPEGSYINMRRR